MTPQLAPHSYTNRFVCISYMDHPDGDACQQVDLLIHSLNSIQQKHFFKFNLLSKKPRIFSISKMISLNSHFKDSGIKNLSICIDQNVHFKTHQHRVYENISYVQKI